MKNWKRLGRALLYPHIAILLILLPVATALLVYSMVFVGTETVIAYLSYALSAYTLTVWCFRIPDIIRLIKVLKNENKYVLRWRDDTRLRVNVSLYGTLALNVAFAVFQLGLGFYHASFWYYSMAAYYVSLAVMRFFLVRYKGMGGDGDRRREELLRYRLCGVVLLFMNLALALIVFFMVYWNRTFVHHEITAIAMAAYTFTALTLAIVNIVKYRKYNSPVYSASRAISLAAACVSMLTLESTMLTAFGDADSVVLNRVMLGATGAVVSGVIVVMAVYMIVQGTKKLKEI